MTPAKECDIEEAGSNAWVMVTINTIPYFGENNPYSLTLVL